MKNTNVTFRQLRAFVQVADGGNFTQAAALLHLTQSGLSVLIRELERELGVRLFDRSPRHVRLTEAGKELYPLAQRTLHALQETLSGIGELRELRRGTVRIAAPQGLAFTQMPRMIAEFERLHPQIELRLQDGTIQDGLDRLEAGDVDLVVSPDVPHGSELQTSLLGRHSHFLVCRPEDPLATRQEVQWAELRTARFISPVKGFLRRLELFLGDALPGGARVREVSYITTAIGMVQAGLGVTACPSFTDLMVRSCGLVMRPLVAPTFHRDVYLYTTSKRSMSPAAESFCAWLKTAFPQESIGKA